MRGLGDGIQEALISIGGKVDGNMSTRSNSSRHFNIQVDFTICAIGFARRRILSAVDRHTCHVRLSDAQFLKVCLEVAVRVPSTEFDESDTLPTAILSRWKVVELGQL